MTHLVSETSGEGSKPEADRLAALILTPIPADEKEKIAFRASYIHPNKEHREGYVQGAEEQYWSCEARIKELEGPVLPGFEWRDPSLPHVPGYDVEEPTEVWKERYRLLANGTTKVIAQKDQIIAELREAVRVLQSQNEELKKERDEYRADAEQRATAISATDLHQFFKQQNP